MVKTGTAPKLASLLAILAVAAGAAWFALGRDDEAAPPAARKPPALTANPATLARVFDAAKGGATIRLEPGDYGTFRGGEKDPPVTLRARKPGTAKMALDLNGAVGVGVKGMVLSSVEIAGSSRHIRIADSRFTGSALVRADRMVNADIVFDGNRHPDIDVCDGCFEGRLHVTGAAKAAAGITVRNSRFGPGGNADGIQTGGDGVRILNNEFVGIRQSEGVHTDAIQLYGSRRTVVRGNWIHDSPTGIVAPDGADHEVIENNVVEPGSYPFAIAIDSDNGSIIRHNTLPGGPCSFNLSCGIVSLGAKEGAPDGRGTVVRDNVLSEVSIKPGATAEASDNLVAPDRLTPWFTGGTEPNSWKGFGLAKGSPGKAAASDGTDLGIAAGSGGPR